MISKLYQNIAAGLKQIRLCTVYREDVPQGFKKPSFMIVFYDQSTKPGINGCLNHFTRVDVHYFPEDKSGVNEECMEIEQTLAREFRLKDFKIKNRNFNITDGVLHFLFDVDYREYLESTETKMTELSGNTELKEV